MMHPLGGALLAVALTVQPTIPAAAEVLTEADFLRLLEGEQPASEALNTVLVGEVRQAEAQALAASQWPNPELEVSRDALDFGSETVEETVEVAVAWSPPRPGVRRHRRAAAESAVTAARAQREARRLELRAEWRAMYARWALAAARVGLLEGQGATLTTLAEQARRRAEAGETAGLEARRLALAAAAVGADLARAEGEAARARAGVAAWLAALPPTTEPRLPELPELPALLALPEGVDGVASGGAQESAPALERHPDLVALAAAGDAARSDQAALVPRFALPRIVLGWQQQEGDGRRMDGPVVGLGWSIPLTHPRRGERAAAAAHAETLEARLALAGRRLGAERAGALAAYHRLRPAAVEAGEIAREVAPAVVAVTRAYHLGEVPLTDLLDTLRAAAEAQRIALEVLDEALEAHRELERLMGKTVATTVGENTP